MKNRHLDAEDRKEQRLRALGTRTPVCVECGEDNSVCLEEHHIAGRKYHEDTALVCRNCHRKLSDLQLDHDPLWEQNPQNELVKNGHYLLGLGDLLELLSKRLREFGHFLIKDAETKEL
ncbi:MAG: hypothetical protein JAZ13_08245 [Candidatus Thiodiazotropha taylori]|nr:hypothetical protein [Candidatus Thiodiazotropha taylori]